MQHITLTTGDVRWSPREEVGDRLMGLLVDHLALALHHRAPIPNITSYALKADAEQGVLIGTVYRDEAPILTMTVVPGGLGEGRLRSLARTIGAAWPWPTPGPWCLVALHRTAILAPREDLLMLGDYERCLAWAWLDGLTDRRVQ